MHPLRGADAINEPSATTNLVCRLAGLLVLGLLVLGLLVSPARGQLPTDRLLNSLEPTADVNDFAGVLTAGQQQALEERCRALREKTGAQLAVVTLKSLAGGQVDDFAVKLFKRWGIGRKSQRDGVLLLVAIEDRQARIEVGYGLEPILPDALAGRILTEQLFPAFRQQQYAQGLEAAVERIIGIIEKNEPPPADLRRPPREEGPLGIVVVLGLFVAAGSFILGANLARGEWRVVPFVGLFILLPLLIGLCLAFPLAPLIHVPLGLFLTWFGYQSMQNHLRGPRGRRSSSWDWGSAGGGSWGPSVSRSGWSGGGFSGGGGGSWGGFGGGSSGGGGASGSW